jgi:uncharacterized protein YyaL (SSP411 family)
MATLILDYSVARVAAQARQSLANFAMNRLAESKSPYLQQHAHNPVDWREWNEESLEAARREDKPIFLSIGYSTCLWCHVMEHESFEDEATAALLNESFIPIKVDREERPDLDRVYMLFVQATNQGQAAGDVGLFDALSLEPFYGGTYFPPARLLRAPRILYALRSIAHSWHTDRAKVLGAASNAHEFLQRVAQSEKSGSEIKWGRGVLVRLRANRFAVRCAAGRIRWRAPKFRAPSSTTFWHRVFATTGDHGRHRDVAPHP